MPVDQDTAYRVISRLYFVLALGAMLGGLQVAAALSGLRGMWLVPSARFTRLLGIVLIAMAVSFFLTAPLWIDGPWAAGSVSSDSSQRLWGTAEWRDLPGAYNINDIDGGLSGTSQAIYFPIAFVVALAVSLLFGAFSVRVLRKSLGGQSGAMDGLELLKSTSYPTTLKRSASLALTGWKSEVTAEFDPAKYPHGVPARLWRRR